MGWEYRDTDCKQKACDYQPRCTAKSKEECPYYDNRTRSRKLKGG